MDLLAVAPVRTADVGGWTDTWFAKAGLVCSVGVLPGVSVRLVEVPGLAPGQVEVEARDLGVSGISGIVDTTSDSLAVDPLLDATIRANPLSFGARCIIESGVPAGSGLGTSAAVVVALLAVLRSAMGESIEPDQISRDAHSIETGLGQQSGVQDQLAAAFGGVNRYRISYPVATQIDSLPTAAMAELLQGRLLTVYLGAPHESSKLHEQVIESLPGRDTELLLAPMVEAAESAFGALSKGDLRAYGLALIKNHEAIRQLHPELISALADEVVRSAREAGAIGWKVNGAGGSGGTIAVLFSDPVDATRFAASLSHSDGCSLLPTTVAPNGVTVTDFQRPV